MIVSAAKHQKLPALPKYLATVKACCKAVGIEMPFPEYKFAAHLGRKFAFDFAWSDFKVALECDGALFSGGRHSRGSGILREHEKFNLAASLGWRVWRCTPQNVGDLALYRQIKGAL